MRLLGRRGANYGQSLVEFALVIPLLFLLFINVVNFGGFFYGWITLANTARAAANYRAQGPATVGAPKLPNNSQVTTLVTADVRALRNKGSVVIRICRYDQLDNSTIICDLGASGDYPNPPADTRAEGLLYEMMWVDIVYNYQPLIPAFSFPNLGVYLTLPPTTLRRQTVMRVMQ